MQLHFAGTFTLSVIELTHFWLVQQLCICYDNALAVQYFSMLPDIDGLQIAASVLVKTSSDSSSRLQLT
jgi:hypothetical protein